MLVSSKMATPSSWCWAPGRAQAHSESVWVWCVTSSLMICKLLFRLCEEASHGITVRLTFPETVSKKYEILFCWVENSSTCVEIQLDLCCVFCLLLKTKPNHAQNVFSLLSAFLFRILSNKSLPKVRTVQTESTERCGFVQSSTFLNCTRQTWTSL